MDEERLAAMVAAMVAMSSSLGAHGEPMAAATAGSGAPLSGVIKKMEASGAWRHSARDRSALCSTLLCLASVELEGGAGGSAVALKSARRCVELGVSSDGSDPDNENHLQALLLLGDASRSVDPAQAADFAARAESLCSAAVAARGAAAGGARAAAAAGGGGGASAKTKPSPPPKSALEWSPIKDPEQSLAAARYISAFAFLVMNQPAEALERATLARAYWRAGGRLRGAPNGFALKTEDTIAHALGVLGRGAEALRVCDDALARLDAHPRCEEFVLRPIFTRTRLRFISDTDSVLAARRALSEALKAGAPTELSHMIAVRSLHFVFARALAGSEAGDPREVLAELDAADAISSRALRDKVTVPDSAAQMLDSGNVRVWALERLGRREEAAALSRKLDALMRTPGIICCYVCKAATKGDGAALDRCARCRSAYYCSRACQAEDWAKRHKAECKKVPP